MTTTVVIFSNGENKDLSVLYIVKVFYFSVFSIYFNNRLFNSKAVRCNDTQYGTGQTGNRSVIGCDKGQEGSKTAICQSTGKWEPENNTCIITKIKELLIYSQVCDQLTDLLTLCK